ncbi:hypothetical protein VNI00_011162 [Paramarasmius palmivorus]|uniref:Integrase catalytic domain-containing protein n=1 Tax=Paramarasmius palmivorus TaxID=297713 RepID=A0AAW0CEH8_9AGAR
MAEETPEFPALPPYPSHSSYSENQAWPSIVYQIHSDLNQLHSSSTRLLSQETDPLRLHIQKERLVGGLDTLYALAESEESEDLPDDWLLESVEVLAVDVKRVHEAIHLAEARDETNIYYDNPITVIKTGKPGRPRKQINPEFMAAAASPKKGLKKTQVAQAIGVSVKTLTSRMDEANIEHRFPKISDNQIDQLVKKYANAKIGSGGRYVTGYIRGTHRLKVPRYRIFQSLKRLSRVSKILRTTKTINRRKYEVKRPNSLWHVDGHHKLILWGIVIHGMVDGYSRVITGLRAHNNNRAMTVLRLLQIARMKYGLPSRIRADRGKENKAISIYMIAKRGLNRGSFIWGSSTRNTRIERLWVEVGKQFARRWRAFFFRLEELHGLDRSNPTHLWLLQRLFLGMINKDCEEFVEEWNSHPIAREGHDQSPLAMRFMGMLKEGMYLAVTDESGEIFVPDDCAGMTIQEIKEKYGTQGRASQRPAKHTGAGYLDDEALDDVEFEVEEGDSSEESDWEDVAEHEVDRNFIERVKAPRCRNPFQNHQELEAPFLSSFQQVRQSRILPDGFGVKREEWENGEYPSFWMLKRGKRSRVELRVELPDSIWRPRSEMWAQALALCLHFEPYGIDME